MAVVSLNRLPVSEADVRVINGELVALHGSGRKTTPINITITGPSVTIDNSSFTVLGGTTAQEVFESTDFILDNIGGAFPLANEEYGTWKDSTGMIDLDIIRVDSANNTILNAAPGQEVQFSIDETKAWAIDATRHLLPEAGSNLGAPAQRVATGYFSDLLAQSATIEGNLLVEGNLTVTGTVTTLNTEELLIADNIITLNSNHTGVPVLDAGIEINRGTSPNARIVWDESANSFLMGISGSEQPVLSPVLANDFFLKWKDSTDLIDLDVLKVDTSNRTILKTNQVNGDLIFEDDAGPLWSMRERAGSQSAFVSQKSVGIIHTNTSDGSDDGAIILNGGGGFGSSRGANIVLFGNEAGGTLNLTHGSGGKIRMGGSPNSAFQFKGNLALEMHMNGSDAQPQIIFEANDGYLDISGGSNAQGLEGSYIRVVGKDNPRESGTMASNLYLGAGPTNNGSIKFFTDSNTEQWNINFAGHFVPAISGSKDVGSPLLPLRNVYVDTLHTTSISGIIVHSSGEWEQWRNFADDSDLDVLRAEGSLNAVTLNGTNKSTLNLRGGGSATGDYHNGGIFFYPYGTNNDSRYWFFQKNTGVFAYGGQEGLIRADNVNNRALHLSGGAAESASNGARVELYGLTHSTRPGVLDLSSGRGSARRINFNLGSTNTSNFLSWSMRGSNILLQSELLYSLDGQIAADTVDGSDTLKLTLGGGGDNAIGQGTGTTTARGAMAVVHGNEHSTSAGILDLLAGDVGHVRLTGDLLPVSGTKVGSESIPVEISHAEEMYFAPTASGIHTAPTTGGRMYIDQADGALYYIGASGTRTLIAPA